MATTIPRTVLTKYFHSRICVAELAFCSFSGGFSIHRGKAQECREFLGPDVFHTRARNGPILLPARICLEFHINGKLVAHIFQHLQLRETSIRPQHIAQTTFPALFDNQSPTTTEKRTLLVP